jgi:hypothetical protein
VLTDRDADIRAFPGRSREKHSATTRVVERERKSTAATRRSELLE